MIELDNGLLRSRISTSWWRHVIFRCFAANANKLAFNSWPVSKKSVTNSYKIFTFFLGLTYNSCQKGWLSILFSLCPSVVFILIYRGGVEDTRLEAKAKAKDTKKIRGQGQGHKKNPRPRPRPRTAFPRTDTLEAKDRNARGQGQGPRTQSASALQKKKKKRSSQKFFRRSPKKKKGLHKKFSSDLHEKTFSKKFFNRSTKF